MTQRYLTELHYDHLEWLNMLHFYEEDLINMRLRLEEVASRNSASDVHVWVERFQNKLTIQDEQIDQLRHDIHQCEEGIIESIENNPVASDKRKSDDHGELRERFQSFELLFNKLRKDLNMFAAKWL